MNENELNNTISTVANNRIDEIAYNTSVIANSSLFLVALIVVILVCDILWKVLDNFISY